jgi:ATP:ADP antiporter, AAA family
VIAAVLSDPVIGLNRDASKGYRVLGFVAYVAIETYGSLMVALFWSFTNSIVNLELAKGAYGLIIWLYIYKYIYIYIHYL